MTGGKWAFLRPCGCIYGMRFDIDGTVTTPMQAWASFYKGESKLRKRDEKAGRIVRAWQDGDHVVWGDCPHEASR